MSLDLSNISNAVTNAVAVMQAAAAKLDALVAQVQTNGANSVEPADIQALADQLKAASEPLAGKVA